MKKTKEYLITILITTAILSIIFLIKGIFPFGSNSIIWSDMHEQVTAMYYHFYDAFHSNGSLLVDFSSGGGINFVGLLAYYIASPFTLLLLVFPRDMLSNAVSLTVAFKIITASVTCHYFLSYYFKNLKGLEKSFLSIIYALSSYVLTLYFITTWMDAVYLFPLFIIGFKKLLDGESPKMYIITLLLFMITTFYMSLILLLFILFSSFIYLMIFKDKKKNKKKIIFNLGVSTVLTMITSGIVLVPSLLEVGASPKLGITLDNITSSKFGPLSDKIAFFFTLGLVISITILQLLKFKKDKKVNLFILLMLLLLGLPVLIEPINKLWHYGNYVYLPYRYGYMITLLLVGASAYYLNNYKKEKRKILDNNKIIPIILGILTIGATILITIKFYPTIIKILDSLSITGSKKVALLLFGVFFINLVTSFITMYLLDYNNKITKIIIYSLVIINILFNCNLYIGSFDQSGKLKLQYDEMHVMYDKNKLDKRFYLKDQDKNLIMNFGMVTGQRTYNNFTSLISDTNFRTLQNLGYDALWIDTGSLGGNIFTDLVLGNKYVFVEKGKEFNDSMYELYYSDKYFDYYQIKSIPFGYFIDVNYSLKNVNNSFEATNLLSNSIMNKEVVQIDEIFKSDDISKYDKEDVFEINYTITEKERLYLEAFTDYYHTTKMKSYDAFKIYVNDELLIDKYPNKKRNGTLYLGEFENATVKIRIEKNNVKGKETLFRNVTVGRIKMSDIDNLLDNYKTNVRVKFDKNNMNIKVNTKQEGIILLPLTYLDGYKADKNDVIKVFDNFVGIKVNKGKNEINVSYFPSELKLGGMLSILGLVSLFIYLEFERKLKVNEIILNLANIAYHVIVFLLIFIYYVFAPISFILSFIIK